MKKQIAEIIWNKLKKFAFSSVHNLIVEIMKNTFINKHFDLLNELLNWLIVNWRFITRWADADYIDCRIEAYMAQYVKITFRSKPKIFNEKTLFKIFLLRQLLVNEINAFDNMKEENKQTTHDEWVAYRIRFGNSGIGRFNKSYSLPYLKNQMNPKMTKILNEMFV